MARIEGAILTRRRGRFMKRKRKEKTRTRWMLDALTMTGKGSELHQPNRYLQSSKESEILLQSLENKP